MYFNVKQYESKSENFYTTRNEQYFVSVKEGNLI